MLDTKFESCMYLNTIQTKNLLLHALKFISLYSLQIVELHMMVPQRFAGLKRKFTEF